MNSKNFIYITLVTLSLCFGAIKSVKAQEEDPTKFIGPEKSELMKKIEDERAKSKPSSKGTFQEEALGFENVKKALENNQQETPFLEEYTITLTHMKYDETTDGPIPTGTWELNEDETWGTFLDIVDNSRPISQRLAYKLDQEKENKDFYVLSSHDKTTGSYMSLFIFENNIMQEQRLIFNVYYNDTIGLEQKLMALTQKYNKDFKPPKHVFQEKGLEVTIKGSTDKENARFLIKDTNDITELRNLFVELPAPLFYNDFLVKKAKTNLFKDIRYFKAYSSAKYENFPYEFAVTDSIIRITDNEYKQKFVRDTEGLFPTIQEIAQQLINAVKREDDANIISSEQTPNKQETEKTQQPEAAPVVVP